MKIILGIFVIILAAILIALIGAFLFENGIARQIFCIIFGSLIGSAIGIFLSTK